MKKVECLQIEAKIFTQSCSLTRAQLYTTGNSLTEALLYCLVTLSLSHNPDQLTRVYISDTNWPLECELELTKEHSYFRVTSL